MAMYNYPSFDYAIIPKDGVPGSRMSSTVDSPLRVTDAWGKIHVEVISDYVITSDKSMRILFIYVYSGLYINPYSLS